MFKLRYGYLISGIITGLVLLLSFVTSLPDEKLHIVFCNVGQGDAAYVRFPDGRDMLVDGGPDEKVIACLSRHMPFWDRKLDLVAMSHTNSDHIAGLIPVIARYQVGYFLRASQEEPSDTYAALTSGIAASRIPVKVETQGDTIAIGDTRITVLSSDNAQGMVLRLSYRSFDALFPGDAALSEPQDGIELVKVPQVFAG